jgi:hypothetical protein
MARSELAKIYLVAYNLLQAVGWGACLVQVVTAAAEGGTYEQMYQKAEWTVSKRPAASCQQQQTPLITLFARCRLQDGYSASLSWKYFMQPQVGSNFDIVPTQHHLACMLFTAKLHSVNVASSNTASRRLTTYMALALSPNMFCCLQVWYPATPFSPSCNG